MAKMKSKEEIQGLLDEKNLAELIDHQEKVKALVQSRINDITSRLACLQIQKFKFDYHTEDTVEVTIMGMGQSKEAPKGSNGKFIIRIMHEDGKIAPLFIIDHKTALADKSIFRQIDNFTSKNKKPTATLVVVEAADWLYVTQIKAIK